MAHTRLDATAAHISPTVIGLYGLSGCGKTFLLEQLQIQLGEEKFAYYEGSIILSSLVPGGLSAFKQLNDQEQDSIRERAIRQIAQECSTTGRIGIVTGHFSFWDNNTGTAKPVWTASDAKTYTHILYLDVPATVVATQRQNDSARVRPTVSVDDLDEWQSTEREQLRKACLENGILFSVIHPSRVLSLLRDIELHTEEYNLSRAEHQLDTILRDLSGLNSNAVLVLDGDRTLIPEDTGALFFELLNRSSPQSISQDPLKDVFKSSLGYSYTAFRQAALVYEAIHEQTFNDYCQQVAASVAVYPEIVSMLKKASGRGVVAVVVTCGLREIWEHIVYKTGCSETVKVIGGGRIEDGFVVTGEVKRALVARLRNVHHKYVCAFGDSVLDLPMLKEADRAVVVVGDEKKRSVQMNEALLNAVNNENLFACQVLLPSTVSPRLDLVRLPSVDITSEYFITSLVSPVVFATDNAAKILMTPMRDATISGPALRAAHTAVGRYLATALLSERIGLETYSISHVQGHKTVGYRFHNEGATLIVALMRGGEPMAMGVNEAMPLAMFIHAKVPSDVKREHIKEKQLIILVDSVINTGKSVVDFVSHIRELNGTVRILVVAGVVQAKALSRTNLAQILTADINFDLIALRQSDNKFTGRGTTDTGNRLFNTTQLE